MGDERVSDSAMKILAERYSQLSEENKALKAERDQWVELGKKLALFHPGCVMPESYSKSMYGLAQAACALLDAMDIDETEVELEREQRS